MTVSDLEQIRATTNNPEQPAFLRTWSRAVLLLVDCGMTGDQARAAIALFSQNGIHLLSDEEMAEKGGGS